MHQRTIRPILALPALVFLLAACGDAPATAGEPVVRDSAGIRIIENPATGEWADDGWALQEELRIGVSSGDPEFQFGNIIGVDVDSEGRIVVMDGQARRVRIFDPEGELVSAFGRSGGGPGEFSQALSQPPGGLFVDAEGAIVVPDLGNQRLARFDFQGEALESPSLTLDSGVPMLWMRSADRGVYKQFRRMDMTGGMPMGDMTDEIVRLEPGTSTGEPVVTLPAGETFSMGSGGMPEIRIFAPEPIWAVVGDGRLVTGLSSEYSLEIRGENGERTIVRRDTRRRPVTEGQKRSFVELFEIAFEEQGVPQEMAGPFLDAIQFEEEWPALARLIGGPDGTLWVQRVDPDSAVDELTVEALQAGDFGSPRWDVFGADGSYLGEIEVPGRFVPFVFDGDYLYGVDRDEFEVQQVVRLRVVR